MIPILTVKEYEKIRIGNEFSKDQKMITRHQAALIEAWERKHNKGIFKWGNKSIVPQQWVGILSVPSLQIEILPKVEIDEEINLRRNLLYMLSISGHISFRESDLGNIQSNKSTFLDIYIKIFLDKLKVCLKKGMIHQYEEVESNESFLKGKLLFSKHIRKNIINKTKFFISYDEFSKDNIPNRILKATIKKLESITNNQENLTNLRLINYDFVEVEQAKISINDFSKFTLTRTNAHYSQILEMCKLIWQDQSTDFFSGNRKTFSLLFDMNKLYENFIQNVLDKYSYEIFGNKLYEVQKRKKVKFLFKNHLGKNAFKLIPDNIVIDKNTGKVIKIIDTKWKLIDPNKPNFGISQSDMYQMYAYAREYNCNDIILLYPKFIKDNKSVLGYYNETFLDRKIKISIHTVDLNVNLPRDLNLIIEELNSFFK